MTSAGSEYFVLWEGNAWIADPTPEWYDSFKARTRCGECNSIKATWNQPIDAELQDVPVDPVTSTSDLECGIMATWVWDVLKHWINPKALHVGHVYITEPPRSREKREDFITFIRHYPLTINQHGQWAYYRLCSTCGRLNTQTSDRYGYYIRKDIAGRDVVLSNHADIIVSVRVAEALAEAKKTLRRVKRLYLKPLPVADALLPHDTWEQQLPGIHW